MVKIGEHDFFFKIWPKKSFFWQICDRIYFSILVLFLQFAKKTLYLTRVFANLIYNIAEEDLLVVSMCMYL